MIQRVQTIYLLIASTLTFCLFGLPYATISSSQFSTEVTTCYLRPYIGSLSTTTMLPLIFVAVLVAIMCLTSIFIYNNRTLQMKLTKINIALQAILLITMVLYTQGITRVLGVDNTIETSFQFALCFPIINIILLSLAFKGIKKDDDLVKSADRLR